MRRWSELNRVERVGLYTRQSLYVVLGLFNGSVLLGNAVQLDPDPAVPMLVGGAAVTALGTVLLAEMMRRHPAGDSLPWRRLTPLLLVSAAYLAVAATSWPATARGSAVMVVVTSLTLPLSMLPRFRSVVGVVLGGGLLFLIVGGEALGFGVGVVVAASTAFSGRASMWLYGIVRELDEANDAQAQLAVAEERLRFSRDVHDILGRRLSTIAVQAELAATLSARGDERAAERMLEVRAVAHEALREARELARGYRALDLPKELEGARSLLRSAGIDVQLSVDSVPRAWHEAAGWVVRESVTNVLRHSSASVVKIEYADGRLRVDNDGARPNGSVDGSGLSGLRERLAPLGATMTAHAYGDDRWLVEVDFPGSGPLSAAGAGQ
jgi:two-component system sensor histidine kinase DesK